MPFVVSVRAVSHLTSPTCPPDIPNASAAALASHLFIFCCILDHAVVACPAAHTFHARVLNILAYQKVSTIGPNVLFSLPLESVTNSAATPGVTRSQVCAFYNIACTLLTLIAQPTVHARCLTALQVLPACDGIGNSANL